MMKQSILVSLLMVGLALAGCDKKKPAKTSPQTGAVPPAPTVKGAPATKTAPAKTGTPTLAAGTKTATPTAKKPAPVAGKPAPAPAGPVARDTAKNLVASVQAMAARGDIAGVARVSTKMSARGVRRFPPPQLTALFKGTIKDVKVNGGREVVVLDDGGKTKNIVTYKRGAGYELDIMKSMRWQEVTKGDADPLNTPITLAEATKGIEGSGTLYAKIATSMGDFNCELYEKKTPVTLANFIGLARGLRGFKDPKTGKWTKRKFYDGLAFHRVIPRFMLQGGDPMGNGSGGPGFTFKDEFHLDLRHTKGGLLSMANRGPNTNGSQFFVTEKDTPWLDDGHSIFGACAEVDLVKTITGVPKTGSRPNTPVVIKTMTFYRK